MFAISMSSCLSSLAYQACLLVVSPIWSFITPWWSIVRLYYVPRWDSVSLFHLPCPLVGFGRITECDSLCIIFVIISRDNFNYNFTLIDNQVLSLTMMHCHIIIPSRLMVLPSPFIGFGRITEWFFIYYFDFIFEIISIIILLFDNQSIVIDNDALSYYTITWWWFCRLHLLDSGESLSVILCLLFCHYLWDNFN